MLVRDGAGALEVETASHRRSDRMTVELAAGGGFLARFRQGR
jgi:hypothetical protein